MTTSVYLSRQARYIGHVGKPAGDSQYRLRCYSQTNITWEMSWSVGPSPEPFLILLGGEVAQSLYGRLHKAGASRRSTMGTSVHPSLILQHLPSGARYNDQWQARLPGQWRHPAALNTFIFPPGRMRSPDSLRQQRRRWRQNEKEKDNGKEAPEESRDRDVEEESLRGSKHKKEKRASDTEKETWSTGGKKEKMKKKGIEKKDKAAQSFYHPLQLIKEAPGSWQRCRSKARRGRGGLCLQ